MNILDRVKKIPGGLMLVPMLITALLNTFCPDVLQIGNPTTAVFTSAGTMTVIGMLLFIAGSQLKVKQLGDTLKRGGVLVIARLAIGFASCWLVLNFFGPDGFLGISALALVVCMSSCNPGVYMALIQNYGDNVDNAAMGVLNVIAVPAIPLLILDISGGGGFDIMIAVATLAPFVIGAVLGNLDPKIQGLFSTGTPIVLVFLGCCFGSVVNLFAAVRAGFSGVLLSAIFVCIGIPLMLLIDKAIVRRPGYAAVAISCVGGVSVSAPSIIAGVLPVYAPYVEAATAQIALTVVITSIIVPILTKLTASRFGSGKEESANS